MSYLKRLTTMGFLAVLLSFLCFAVIQQAGNAAPALTTRYVAPGGNCNGVTPCYATVQAAVDAADPGDVIKVAEGQK